MPAKAQTKKLAAEQVKAAGEKSVSLSGWLFGSVLRLVLPVAVALVFSELFSVEKQFDTGDDLPNYVKNKLLAPVGPGEWLPRAKEIVQADSIIGVWEPVSLLVKLVLVNTFGLHPRTFSGAAAVFHGLCCTLALEVTIQGHALLGCRIGVLHAWCAVLLIGIHPLRVEPLAWASGFSYALSTFFALLAVLCHIRHRGASKNAAAGQACFTARPYGPWRLLAALLFVLASNAKAASLGVVAVPGLLDLLLLWELRPKGSSAKVRWWACSLLALFIDHLPMLLAIAPAAYPAFTASKGPDKQCRFDFSWPQRFLRAAHMVVLYLAQQVWPKDLCVLYAVPVGDINSGSWQFGGAALVVVVLLLVALRKGVRHFIGVLAYLALLSPTMGLLTNHIAETAADRYCHITFMIFGVPVLAGLLASCRPSLGPIALGALMAIVAVEASVTRNYVLLWHRQDLTIRQAVKASPRFWRTRYIYGMDLANRQQLVEAEEQLRESLVLCPEYGNTYYGLTQVLYQGHRSGEAIEAMRAGVNLDPTNYLGHFNVGMLLQGEERHAEAVDAFTKALDIEPSDRDAHQGLQASRQALAQGASRKR